MAVKKQSKPKVPVDTVRLKKDIKRLDKDEQINRTLQRQNEGKAISQRQRLKRSSIGETIAYDDAKHFKRHADGAYFSKRAKADSLEAERSKSKKKKKS